MRRFQGIPHPEPTHTVPLIQSRGLALPCGISLPLERWTVLALSEPFPQLPFCPSNIYWNLVVMAYQFRAVIRCKEQRPSCTGVEVGSQWPQQEPGCSLLFIPLTFVRFLHPHVLICVHVPLSVDFHLHSIGWTGSCGHPHFQGSLGR